MDSRRLVQIYIFVLAILAVASLAYGSRRRHLVEWERALRHVKEHYND